MTSTQAGAQLSAAPGNTRRDVRPPIEMDAAPYPGAAAPVRPTARKRRLVSPETWPGSDSGTPLLDGNARRRWCALIGPGAVADLLRLATAAARGRSLPRPVNLDMLARYGLVTADGDRLFVRMSFPTLSVPLVRRLHPALRVDDDKTPPSATVLAG